MSGAKINYFDSFDDSLFVYDGGKRTEPACVIPAEMENQIRYDEKGDRYISLLIASFPAANYFLKMEFIVAGIHTGDDGTIYCPFSLASNLAGDIAQRNDPLL
ncbi:MAG: hypothetical protein Q4A41_01865 [Bacillota bacterium]|nr:hypothetical protein [Bacillota bacterium]